MEWKEFNERGIERRIKRRVDADMRELRINLAFMLGSVLIFMVVVILMTWGVMSS